MSPANSEEFASAVSNRGAALQNCWGFIDGTVRPISRPGENQRCLYNGHKKVHAIKFQSIATPNGLVANLYGVLRTFLLFRILLKLWDSCFISNMMIDID